MSVFKLPGSSIQANTITSTQLTTALANQISSGGGGGPKVKTLIYPGNDTAANSTGGQTVYVNGSGFAANAQVLVNGAAVPSQSFISASNISFSTPALSTGTYPVYVINPEDGGTAILYPGLLISGEPTWVTSATLPGVDVAGTWSISLSATGDAPITYALAAGNTLPSGITLAANGLISGTLSSPPETETTYTFNVVATDAQNQDSTRQFSITASTGEGVLFANNVLLIHADGTNNGNNHAFLDSSNNNFTITRNGNATQGSFSPFSQTGWSAYFDGSGDSLQISHNTALDLGSGDFTIEFWMNTPSWSSGTGALIGKKLNDGTSGWQLYRDANSPTKINARLGAQNNFFTNSAVTQNVWEHWALVRTGSTVYWFKNGVLDNTGTSSTNLVDTSASLNIGYANTWDVHGTFYISNLRIVKGTALYTSSFTPSTSALTAISNTSLLTCQSNRFIDNSTNAFTITRNGDVSIQAFSPFAPTAAYSTANVGGSAYFDGTGDYLTSPSTSAFNFSGDFTIEFWIYPTAAQNGLAGIAVQGTDSDPSWFVQYDAVGTSAIRFNSWSQNILISSAVPPRNTWTHYAFVRSGSGSNNFKLYVNGVVDVQTTFTSSIGQTSSLTIGGGYTGGGRPGFAGYIGGLRINNGTAVYTSAFTPPTSPLTNIANTSLLCNFTNAQIFDQTAKNVLECVGDAKVSTAQYKYGTGSIAFDGTGDWLLLPANRLLDLSGDFTIETWLYPTAAFSTYRMIIANKNASPDAYICIRATNTLEIVLNGSLFSQTTVTVPQNSWTHLAVTRSGSSVKAFIDGTAVLTSTSSATWNFNNNNGTYIGRWGSGGYEWYGYMDDFRITNGYARYTSNFTPPASALKDK